MIPEIPELCSKTGTKVAMHHRRPLRMISAIAEVPVFCHVIVLTRPTKPSGYSRSTTPRWDSALTMTQLVCCNSIFLFVTVNYTMN